MKFLKKHSGKMAASGIFMNFWAAGVSDNYAMLLKEPVPGWVFVLSVFGIALTLPFIRNIVYAEVRRNV